MTEGCPFCGNCEPSCASNEHAIAIADKKPLSLGHTLIIPRVHLPTIFDLPIPDYISCFELLREVKDLVAKENGAENFHVVVNCGLLAGQTVPHAHIHLVPRYPDVKLPITGHSWTQIV